MSPILRAGQMSDVCMYYSAEHFRYIILLIAKHILTGYFLKRSSEQNTADSMQWCITECGANGRMELS